MGRSLASTETLPFGLDGIRVNSTKLADGTTYNGLYIYRQRNAQNYDLMDSNGNIYENLTLTGLDKNGQVMLATRTDVSSDLPNGTFAINIYDEAVGANTGWIAKLMLNKIILGDGSTYYKSFQTNGSVPVDGIFLGTNTVYMDVGEYSFVSATVTPRNAFSTDLVWTSSDKSVVEVVKGRLYAKSAGSAEITVASLANPNYTTECVVYVELPSA